VPSVLAEARRLDELRAGLVTRRLRLLVETGAAASAVADAEARLAEAHEHVGEPTWVVLVDALVAAGRPADAVRAAQRARAALAEFGLVPGPDLLAAEARALDPGVVSGDRGVPGDGAVLQASGSRSRTVPLVSSFVGRQHDVDVVAELVTRHRIVCLVGSGGVGKTRLARETVAGPLTGLGSWFVSLGHLSDGADVASAVTSSLGLIGRDPEGEHPLERAGELDGVLVLDNAEHVIDHVAAAVGRIMAGGSRLRVLVTSQERLGIDGEHVHEVRPLAHLDRRDPGQQLLIERATAAGAAIDVASEGAWVDRVVAKLDGLPLAIEMAAAQLTTCTVRELSERLDEGHTDLTSARRDVSDRHRTLAGLIDWSLDRLAADEVEVLRDLTVFAGSFDLDDVAAVLGRGAVAATRRLAERSLLMTTRDAQRVHFAHFHVVREHLSTNRSTVSVELRRRHARWCVETVRSFDATMATVDEPAARARIISMLSELRAAHHWASTNERATALALSAGLHRFAHTSLHDEMLGWAERLVSDGPAPDDDPADVAVVLASVASRLVNQGESARGAEFAALGVRMAPDDRSSLPAYELSADAALYEGRLDECRVASREAYERARRCGDRWYRMVACSELVLVAVYGGTGSDELLADLDAEDLDAAPPTPRAFIEYARGELLAGSDPSAALAQFQEMLALTRSVPSPFTEGVCLSSIAALHGRSGNLEASLHAHRDAIGHWLALADRSHQATTLRNLVPVVAGLGRDDDAAVLVGVLDVCGIPTYGLEAERVEAARAEVSGRLGPDRFEELRRSGTHLSVIDGARWMHDRLTG
jgi:predicted ATPase